LKRPRFALVNLLGIGYRITSKLIAHSYSQSINTQKCVGLFGYSGWLSRHPHLKLEELKISETSSVNGRHRKNILNTRISRHLLLNVSL